MNRKAGYQAFRKGGIHFHANFGTGYGCARLANALDVPVLLWGPRDEHRDANGISGGVSCGGPGMSHHSAQDIAAYVVKNI